MQIRREAELQPEQRLAMIERVIKYKVPVTKICQAYRISRPTFYKWLKRYEEALGEERLEAMREKKTEIKRHPRQTPELYEEAVLNIVANYPQLGVDRITKVLPRIAGKAIVSYHGVQKILERYSLNTYEQRLTYAEAQITPTIRVIAKLKGFGTRFIALPVEARAQIIRFASVTFASAFLTTIVFGIIGYFVTITAGIPASSKIGLFFATAALFIGSFFFLYSMKYYLTLALVLSFSRQSVEGGGGYNVSLGGKLNGNHKNGNGNGGWLRRIFGLNGNGRKNSNGINNSINGNGAIQTGGLQPSLDHVQLKRYPFVSIHLPFYNEKKVAERIMSACTSMDYPNYEIIICDDSTDETIQIVQKFAKEHNQKLKKEGKESPVIKVLHRSTREGFKGAALSFAVKKMNPRTEFCVVFDADFVPYPDTLEVFVKYFKANNNGSENYKQSNIAVVGGYQWHVLNKSENWVTRGVRTEYAGSYVIERPGREIMGLLKQISGSVYMIRADVIKEVGWATSITEDFELTLKLYEKGYKVVYTPYVQAPAECVSTLKRLIRQRMRWAEGHSNNIRKMFWRLMKSPKLTIMEKIEVLYISPYYLQAFFFLLGTIAWLISETVFPARLPFWTSLWGWSLVLTNFFSLPLVNAVGLFLEESEEKDYLGLLSFIALSYILVPFQAYASVKGFLQKEEGGWFRTPKSGKITDIFTRGKFYRWISGILPGRRTSPAIATVQADNLAWLGNPYVSLATANNQFNDFTIKPKRMRWVSKVALVILLCLTTSLFTLAHNVSVVLATPTINKILYIQENNSGVLTTTLSDQLIDGEPDIACDTTQGTLHSKNAIWIQIKPDVAENAVDAGTPCPASATGTGWIFDTSFDTNGSLDGDITFDVYTEDNTVGNTGYVRACVYRAEVDGTTLGTSTLFFTATGTTDVWVNGALNSQITTTDPCGAGCTFTEAEKYLYIDFYIDSDNGANSQPASIDFGEEQCGTPYPRITISSFVIPEKVILLALVIPFLPCFVGWLRRRRGKWRGPPYPGARDGPLALVKLLKYNN